MAITATYVSATTFTISGTQTSTFMEGRRVKADCGVNGYKYGTILSSAYTSVTTVILTAASDDLTSNLTEVEYGIIGKGTNQSLPIHAHDGNEGAGGQLDHTDLSNIGSTAHSAIDTHIADADKHREINDSGLGITDLWSAVKIEDRVTTATGSLTTDHGSLTGLADDDHLHYHTDSRGDARYYTQTLLNNGQLDSRYYTETEIDALWVTWSGTIDHNTINNYVIDEHRTINDSGTAVTDLWSAQKITDELATISGGSGVTDHGALTGLDDASDHTWASLVDGTRAFTGVVGGVTPTADAHLVTKAYADTLSGTVNHSELNQLDYANAGHTGFQAEGDYVTDTEMTTISGDLQTNIDDKMSDVSDDATPQLGGDLELSGYLIEYTPIPGSDLSFSGFYTTMTVDSNSVGITAALAVDTDSNLVETHTTTPYMPCFVMAMETGTGSKKVFNQGYIRNDAWAWTVGDIIYVSGVAAGSLTQTAPTISGALVQVIGVATHADRMFFSPNFGMLELN